MVKNLILCRVGPDTKLLLYDKLGDRLVCSCASELRLGGAALIAGRSPSVVGVHFSLIVIGPGAYCVLLQC